MAAANKAPPYPKQKYSDAKFREIIPQLNLAEYLKVEVLTQGIWIKMISKRNNSYNCECCGVDNVGPTPITDHVRGKKHRIALQAADQLYHPNYTGPKNSKEPASTPILDAYKSVADGKTIPVKVTKPVPKPAVDGKSIPVKVTKPPVAKGAALAQKTGVQQNVAPKGTVTQSKSPAAQSKAPATQAKAPAAQPVQKTTAAQPKVAATVQPKAAAAQKKPQAKPPVAKKPNVPVKVELTQSDDVVQGTDAQSVNDVQAIETANETQANEIDSQAKSTDAQPKVQEKTASEETSADENNKQATSVPQVQPEVIELSDDGDVGNTIQPLPKRATDLVINITTPSTAKPQRPQKRTANAVTPIEQESQPEPKKTCESPAKKEDPPQKAAAVVPSKKVINPAAVLAKVNEKSPEEPPRYQQNRVVIPTIDKTRKRQPPPQPLPQSKAAEEAAPSFSSKSFTSTSGVDGIIGVEYVVKILKVYNDPEPFYECCLCEVVMDGVGMQTHLLGYNHRYKYLEKHFPTCFNQYKEHIGNIQVMGVILDRVAKAIEAHHGRELPYECLSGEFRSNRHGVMTTVYSFRHASEYSGPSFTNVVDALQIDQFYKQKNIYQPPRADPKRKPTFDTRNGTPKRSRPDRGPIRPTSSGRGGSRSTTSRRSYHEEVENNNPIDDAVHKQMVEEFLQNTQGRSRSPGRRRRHRSRSRSRSPHRSSHRRHRRSPSPLREGDVWQAYRHLVDRSKVELDDMYSDYRKDPEKHPLYDEEWRKFWKYRKEQIAREGLDYRNYDFQPEWVRYFALRIEELYDEALEDIKISSRRRLFLPMTNEELEDSRYHVKVTEDSETPVRERREQEPGEDKNNVVSVLRLLTALEDYLGSLGPRVVDLLSKALLVEKSNPSNVNEIILSLDNCTILETAMEKLKGVLIAGLLEGPKVRAFNNVISETESILKTAFKIRQRNPQPAPQPVPAPKLQQTEFPKQTFQNQGGSFMHSPQPNPPPVATGGGTCGAAASLLSQIDKKELAAKLAAALTAQGKTDFNPEQLQQLIAVYSLIDKKKRDSAAADKQKMPLSDTLTALLNPSEKSGGGGGMSGSVQPSIRPPMGNYPNNNSSGNRSVPVSSSSINNFVSMLSSRDNLSTGTGGNRGDNQMWQNLQNIQNSLRMQNNSIGGGGGGLSNAGGFNSNSMSSGGGGVGSGGFRDNTSSSSNFAGSGFATFDLGQNSSMNFGNRGSTGIGGSSGDKDGFSGNFQNMGQGYSRGGGDDMHGNGGGQNSNSNNFSSGNSFSRGGGTLGMMGGNNSSNFSRGGIDGGFRSGGGNLSSTGFSNNFTGSGMGLYNSNSGGGNTNSFQRNIPINNGGQGMGDNSGGNFNRSGGSSSGFGNSMGGGGNFNKNSGGGGNPFGSMPRSKQMGRGSMGNNSMGSNSTQNRSGGGGGGSSNWRNQ